MPLRHPRRGAKRGAPKSTAVRSSLVRLARLALPLIAAGCAASLPQTAGGGARQWMRPAAKYGDLLYVSNLSEVNVYSYPQDELQGRLTGFSQAGGECSDRKGDVFITDGGTGTIVEYAHGGTSPLETLTSTATQPNGCAIDSRTGNLAVANWGGNVAVYPKAKGNPKVYTNAAFKAYAYCVYDDKGNLFVDGYDASYSLFEFAELRHGGHSLTSVDLGYSGSAGGLQWDGRYVVVGQQLSPTLYRYSIGGSKGTLEGTTPLTSASEIFQFVIFGKRVVVPNLYFVGYEAFSDVLIFHYPGGGSETGEIGTGIEDALGVAVSP